GLWRSVQPAILEPSAEKKFPILVSIVAAMLTTQTERHEAATYGSIAEIDIETGDKVQQSTFRRSSDPCMGSEERQVSFQGCDIGRGLCRDPEHRVRQSVGDGAVITDILVKSEAVEVTLPYSPLHIMIEFVVEASEVTLEKR